MKIAVLCPSEIALRRFMPALEKTQIFDFVGVGTASPDEWFGDRLSSVPSEDITRQQQSEKTKAEKFTSQFGGVCYRSYVECIAAADAIYIPLPPGLHFEWAGKALSAGKHVLVEKPATTTYETTYALMQTAKQQSLALHENYMFTFHRQLHEIEEIIHSGKIGDIRLLRISFGFPRRNTNDFRYNRKLGGGALLDCGGYVIRYALRLLGESAKLTTAQANFIDGFEVDMFGSATMTNSSGMTAQLAFGMDNQYKCDLEIWGSTGSLRTGRVLTAPAGFVPTIEIQKGNERETLSLSSDDAFGKSIQYFRTCIENAAVRCNQYRLIVRQAAFVDEFKKMAGIN